MLEDKSGRDCPLALKKRFPFCFSKGHITHMTVFYYELHYRLKRS